MMAVKLHTAVNGGKTKPIPQRLRRKNRCDKNKRVFQNLILVPRLCFGKIMRVCQVQELQMGERFIWAEIVQDHGLFVLVLIKAILTAGSLVNSQAQFLGVQTANRGLSKSSP